MSNNVIQDWSTTLDGDKNFVQTSNILPANIYQNTVFIKVAAVSLDDICFMPPSICH